LRAAKFGLPNGLGVLLERLDSGDSVEGLKALEVLIDLAGDDGLGGFGFAAAVGEVGLSDLLQVVDVVDEATLHVVHARVDVAGDGDIDEEHGTVAAALEEVLAVGSSKDLLRRAGGGDDDVGAVGLLVELIEGDDLAFEVLGDLLGPRLGPVGYEDGSRALLDEMAGGELGHLACSYKEDRLAFEGVEDFSCEVYGDRGDGDGAGAYLCFRADALGYGEGALQEAFERGGDCAYFAACGVSLFDLAENLRLAYDHAIERAGDAEEMADGLALAELVEMRLEIGCRKVEVLVEEVEGAGVFVGGMSGVLHGEQFDAVAGGEDDGFADAGLMGEGAGSVGEARGSDGEALAYLDGRGVVIDAEEDQIRRCGIFVHGAVNLWTTESWLAAQTARTTRKTKLDR